MDKTPLSPHEMKHFVETKRKHDEKEYEERRQKRCVRKMTNFNTSYAELKLYNKNMLNEYDECMQEIKALGYSYKDLEEIKYKVDNEPPNVGPF